MTPVERVRNDTSIRQATRADLLDVLRIEQSVFPQPWPYSAFERHVDAPGFLVSERDADDDSNESSEENAGDTGTVPDEQFLEETLADADAALDDESFGGEDDVDAPAAALAAVTGLDDSITGYVVATEVPDHGRSFGHVKNLAVHPDCQNEGVGSALLARSLSVLAGRGVRGAKLEVRRSNDAAIGLYRSFGFEYRRTIQEYYADGEDALLFVATLEDRDGF